MSWVDYYLEKDRQNQAQAKQAQQNQIWNDAMTTRASRKPIDGVDPMLAKVNLPNPGYANPTVKKAAEVVDTVLNRPGYAFRNAMIEQMKERDEGGYLHQFAPGSIAKEGKAFWAGMTGQARPTTQDVLSAERVKINPDTLGGKAVNLVGDIVTNPVNFVGGGAGKIAKLPLAGKIATGAGIGGTFAGASAFGEQLPAGQVAAATGIGAALGGGISGIGGLKDAFKPKIDFDPSKLGFGDEAGQVAPRTLDNLSLPFYPKGTSTEVMQNPLLQKLNKDFTQAKSLSQKVERDIANAKAAELPPKPITPLPQQPSLNRNVDMGKLPNRYPLPDVSNLEQKALDALTPEQQLARQQKSIVERLIAEADAASKRVSDRNLAYSDPNAMHFKPRDPVEDLKDLTIIGAGKIAKTGLNFEAWSKAMIQELGKEGKVYEPALKYIWEHSQAVATNGSTVLKYGGKNIAVSLPKGAGSTTGQPKEQVPATGQAGGNVAKEWDHTTTKTDAPGSSLKQKVNRTYSAVIDDLYRINQVDNLSKGLDANEKAYVLAQNAKQSGGTAKHIVTTEMVDPNGNKVGESLKDITKLIPAGKTKDFENYLIYRHAPSWLDNGQQVFPEAEGITSEISRQRAAVYEAQNPEFKQIADKLIAWHKKLAKTWLVDTGVISEKQWAAMDAKYPDYIPFKREMSDVESMGGFVRGMNPIKEAKGSERKIISPIESIIEHTDMYVRTAKRNQVMQAIDGQIARDPQALAPFIERIPDNVTYDKPNTVTAKINGENVRYKVNDVDLLKAFEALSPKADEGIIQAARQITRTMKVLTTGGNPIFATRNVARDLPMAYIASDTLTNVPVAREVQFAWGILDSFGQILTKGKWEPGNTYKTFKALGGGAHSSAMAADRNLLAESKASVLPGYYSFKAPLKSVGRGIKAVGRGIEQVTNAVETAPRYAEFKRTVKQGGDTAGARQQGLFNAQDVTVNFSKHGSLSLTPDAFIPYLNAALQGIDKVGRIYQKNPLLATMRSLTAVTIPTMMVYFAYKDDKDYQQLSNWTKDNYYCIKMPGGKFLKIAKPREVGVAFGSLVERCLRKWEADDPKAFKGFSETWINAFAPPIRPITAPLTDVVANKNFSGSPIVPGYMQNLEPSQQFDETTSMPARKLGELTGVSPKKADYLLRSYTGVLGELGIPATSVGRGETATQRMGNTVNKAFTADPLYSNDVLSNFYDQKDKLDKANTTFKTTKVKNQDFNEAKRKAFSAAADQIGEISKKIRAINANKALTFDQKDQQVRALKQKQLDIATTVNR